MTQKDPSDFDPKHRIIGAVIIVALAVIFVPMILDRRSAPDTPNVSEIPAPTSAPDNKVVVTAVPPPEPKPSAAVVEAQSPKPPAASEPPKPASALQAPKVATDKPPAPANKTASQTANAAPAKTTTKPAAKPEPKATPVKSGWVVQVGTFANAANATRLEEQLKKHGHAVSRERVASNGGNALRLRVGPFKDKTLAIKAQGQIQKETGVQGVVLAYP